MTTAERPTHHRIVVRRRGGPEVLEAIEEAWPEPADDEVLVRVRAAGVSAYDCMLRRARLPGFPRVPFTPGVDVVGDVVERGPGVRSPSRGQRVAALLPHGGGYAELVRVPASVAVVVPGGVDPAEAACVVANYVTASAMLHRAARVRAGERVLIHGGAGGVGSALLELGRRCQLQLYATASAPQHELVASLGAVPIDYRREDFVARIRELTGDGVDVVFDPIGGARQLWRSYRALRKGGRLIWFGVAASARSGMRVIPESLLARAALSAIPDGKAAPMPPDAAQPNDWYRQTLAQLLEWLRAGELRPLVAARIPLLEAASAHERLERGGHAGKLVLIADT
jgi:NADPH:quinone reductase